MTSRWLGLVAAVVLSLRAGTAFAAAPPASAPGKPTPLVDDKALAAKIDELLAARWAAQGIRPAPLTDDAEFIRRVYLDLAGCIPSIIDIRDFLDDTRPDKRRIWVQELLTGKRPTDKPEAYPEHLAAVMRGWLLSRVNNDLAQNLTLGLEGWLRQRLKENAGYDQLVREMITAGLANAGNSGPGLFDAANENKPENLAASTSRLFLGIKLECAQCHDDRSGGSWTRKQFWEFAAFFASIPGQPQANQAAGNDGTVILADQGQLQIPGKKQVVKAHFLDGKTPGNGVNPREALAGWLTAADNPYFARAAVNRLWAYLFGTGLVEPVEEQGRHNPPSHPELLDELARQFAAHRYDLKYLLTALTASRAYQLSSVPSHPSQETPRSFARMAVRGLSAEQLFDSLAEATEYKSLRPSYPQDNTPRSEFVGRFGDQGKRTETQTSILQALYLMNSQFIADRTSLEQNKALATIAEAVGLTTARRIETLYLVVLSRKPRADELERLGKYVDGGGPGRDPRQALADVFWALLNSAEFRLNR
jgi:hypothetical protein